MIASVGWCRASVLACMLGVWGCGGAASSPAAAQTLPAQQAQRCEGHMHGGEGHHAHRFPPGPVSEFHDVLAPLWHSDAGAARDARTCEQAATLRQRAGAIVTAPPPEQAQGHEEGWHTSAAALERETEALVTECSGARSAVAQRLAGVHTAFHRLIEHIGEHHGGQQ